ncbi:MAG: aminoglycoside phosphotransferase family protein [Clostridia bacterium]|nr:aminoglycoside phosphotransferase family protein [Clostridia bacterium]
MLDIISRFRLEGTPIHWARYGSGHINETYLVVTGRPHLYILQKLNGGIFKDGEGLMANVRLVTEHIRKKEPDPRRCLTLVPTLDGGYYLKTAAGEICRTYEFVTGSVCLDRAGSPGDLRHSGEAFGRFQTLLKDLPASGLKEILPGFHDTPKRYEALKRAVREDRAGRVRTARREIDGYLERETAAGYLTRLRREGALPLRVTHNDTKLNNVLLDDETREPLCVIDLDTVMPGLAACDFGDAVRFGASAAAEDEKDLDKVRLALPYYRAWTEGFLGACRESLTPDEIRTLPEGALIMTLECGARFLTDYLEGDTYFHISRPEHNLDRARTQLKLAEEMEARMDEMRGIVMEAEKTGPFHEEIRTAGKNRITGS